MIDRSQFPKVRCKHAFTSEGIDAAVALGKELGVPESKMQRWLREWSGTHGKTDTKVTRRETKTMSSDTSTLLKSRKKQVEIVAKRGKGKPMLGYVLNAGPEQSEIYITDGPESLIDKVQYFSNDALKEIKSKREL